MFFCEINSINCILTTTYTLPWLTLKIKGSRTQFFSRFNFEQTLEKKGVLCVWIVFYCFMFFETLGKMEGLNYLEKPHLSYISTLGTQYT